MKQVTYEGLTFQPYISKEEIAARVEEIGQQIMRDCADKMPLFVCVLNGAFPLPATFSELLKDLMPRFRLYA